MTSSQDSSITSNPDLTSSGTTAPEASQWIDVDVDLEISTAAPRYTPRIIRSRFHKIGVKFWIVENAQRCLDCVKPLLTVQYSFAKLTWRKMQLFALLSKPKNSLHFGQKSMRQFMRTTERRMFFASIAAGLALTQITMYTSPPAMLNDISMDVHCTLKSRKLWERILLKHFLASPKRSWRTTISLSASWMSSSLAIWAFIKPKIVHWLTCSKKRFHVVIHRIGGGLQSAWRKRRNWKGLAKEIDLQRSTAKSASQRTHGTLKLSIWSS